MNEENKQDKQLNLDEEKKSSDNLASEVPWKRALRAIIMIIPITIVFLFVSNTREIYNFVFSLIISIKEMFGY